MKKFLVMLLAFAMVLCFAACGETEETSSTPATSSEATSSEEASKEVSSEATSSEAVSSEEESSEAESSVEESSEEEKTADGESIASFISQFFSYEGTIGTGTVGVKTNGAKSVRLTSLNAGAVDGVAGILGFTSDYEETDIYSADGSYDNYEIFVFEYDYEKWGCKLTDSYGLDAEGKGEVAIPEDGFVVAVHKHFENYIAIIKAATETDIFTPYGFCSTREMDTEVYAGTPTIDGKVEEGEWGDAVWVYEHGVEYICYEQFDNKVPDEGYYSTATVYINYDAEYLYLGVVVDSPYHYNNFTPTSCSGMYDQECIQVNICSADPKGEYIANAWDNHEQHANVATGANVVRQYGYGVNGDGESLKCAWMGGDVANHQVACSRDNEAQITVYEIAIPLAEIIYEEAALVGEAGTVMGLSVSINSGREGYAFLNYYMRDGGGIIGRNDWSKVPQITFGE